MRIRCVRRSRRKYAGMQHYMTAFSGGLLHTPRGTRVKGKTSQYQGGTQAWMDDFLSPSVGCVKKGCRKVRQADPICSVRGFLREDDPNADPHQESGEVSKPKVNFTKKGCPF